MEEKTEEKEKEVKYAKGTVSRYKNGNNGIYYGEFLKENNISKNDFEKKSFQEQGTELVAFYEKHGYSTGRKSNKVDDTKIADDDFIGIIRSINASDKCSSDEKVSLTNEVLSLENKINEVKKLQDEIDTIYAKIHEII